MDRGDNCSGVKPDRKVRACVHTYWQYCRFFNQLKTDKVTHIVFLLLWQMRKPLVEKKRRARINESLQELRVLVADADVRYYEQTVRPLLFVVLFPNNEFMFLK